MGEILAVCVSNVRGVQKRPVEGGMLIAGHGLEGDAHAGDWHRQVSLLSVESVDRLREKVDIPLPPGAFAENLLVSGLRVWELPVGSRLRIGGALCRVTQIGKECHHDCAIRKAAGDCVMPREGIFAEVLASGPVRPGDDIDLAPDET